MSIDAAVTAALGTRYSAAVVHVTRGGRAVFERAYGTLARGDATRVYGDTAFDLASITKVFVASAALMLVARGALLLDGSLVPLVPEWQGTERSAITLRMLLAHTGGFRSGADYRTLLDRRVERFALIEEPLVAAPGERVVYTDLGFITLGIVVARAAGCSLRAFIESELRAGGAASTAYVPGALARAMIPATERDAWRGLVQGTVHDEKAALMNGVSGHAGLFGTARDVAQLGEWYLGPLHGRPSPIANDLAAEAVREAAYDPVLRRGLGWALKTNDENSCGTLVSDSTFGHTGFTGTCIWADPERDLSIVLLTNAVHFGRHDLREVRIAVCDAAVRAYG